MQMFLCLATYHFHHNVLRLLGVRSIHHTTTTESTQNELTLFVDTYWWFRL